MKRKLIFFLNFCLAVTILNAKVPLGIPYQAAARNLNGQPLVNRSIQVRFSVLDSIATCQVLSI